MRLIIITGINKGLGEAIFDHYIDCSEYEIVGISRRINKKQEELLKDNKFSYIPIDLLKLKNPYKDLKISDYLKKASEVTFINNAATINPINRIGDFDDEEILQLLHLNVAVPLMITNYLFKEIPDKKINLVNISSGAAKRPIKGWSLYCTSKAATEMFFNTLTEQEKNNPKINVLNIDPGVIDSTMQEVIRNTSNEVFPQVNTFISLKENNQLQSPKEAALKIIDKINSFNN